jgi:hypothetical protein
VNETDPLSFFRLQTNFRMKITNLLRILGTSMQQRALLSLV